MKKNILIPAVLVLLYCFSCINKKDAQKCMYKSGFDLESNNTIRKFPVPINIDSRVYKISSFINDENKELLYFLNKRNHLLVYDLEKQSLIEQIKIAEKGPNGFDRVGGFKVLNQDSIIITPFFKFKLGVVNSQGVKISEIDYGENRKYPRTLDNNNTHIFIKGNEMFLPMYLEGNWTTKNLSEFKEYKTTLKYNFKNHTHKLVGMHIPYESSKLKLKRHFNFVSQFKNGYVIAFASSHNIYFTEDFETFKSYECKSKNINALTEYCFTNDFKQNLYNRIRSTEYTKLLWDPHRNYLYRFYKLGKTKVSKNDDLMAINNEPNPFGIMVLDSSYNIIVDKVFDNNIYDWEKSFIGKEGLYLSISDSDNMNLDLNSLSFEIFSINTN
ncbi:DUF4221 family protein [Marinifilum caeruleilacunae]|uniref:DUF4221 domain-containing protein n=1 Tax=Marinifilum caeruleilacunae TaxID=2499076 RepID=A0ABX1X0Y3_9BACT|nr:DUF4221 family protein [Marinifilum caeruleilacunae]NOU62035.1 DUF4221 domain-containing protein [Marinifilum caeruleilacunae]